MFVFGPQKKFAVKVTDKSIMQTLTLKNEKLKQKYKIMNILWFSM